MGVNEVVMRHEVAFMLFQSTKIEDYLVYRFFWFFETYFLQLSAFQVGLIFIFGNGVLQKSLKLNRYYLAFKLFHGELYRSRL